MSTRKPFGGVIFAPNTAPGFSYGFLVRHCLLTTDSAYHAAPTSHFGRSWDQSASTTGYLPGIPLNGQLVIRDSYLGAGLRRGGTVGAGRHHRPPVQRTLWEYANSGPSAN